MVYTTVKNKINNNTIKYHFIKTDGNKLTYTEFINLLKSKNKDFIKEFDRQLSQAPAELSLQPTAYFWECIPVSQNTLDREFEFVAVKSKELDNIKQDLSSFQEHFQRSSDSYVVSFPSLSGDTLVVPMPVRGYQYNCNEYVDEMRDYKNLREFNCNASMEQKENFWQKVGEKMAESLLNANNAPRWLSTSGLGVSYLHVRIDSRPKYYTWEEYKEFKKNNDKPNSVNDKDDKLSNQPASTTNQSDDKLNQPENPSIENLSLSNDSSDSQSSKPNYNNENSKSDHKKQNINNSSTQQNSNQSNKINPDNSPSAGRILVIISLAVGVMAIFALIIY